MNKESQGGGEDTVWVVVQRRWDSRLLVLFEMVMAQLCLAAAIVFASLSVTSHAPENPFGALFWGFFSSFAMFVGAQGIFGRRNGRPLPVGDFPRSRYRQGSGEQGAR